VKLALTDSLESKRSQTAHAIKSRLRSQPALTQPHATLPISLSNHATCSWHLITRKMDPGDTVRETHRRGRRGWRSKAESAAYHYTAISIPREDVHLLRIVWDVPSPSVILQCASHAAGGTATDWLALLLWSRSEASFSGRKTQQLSWRS
jgi:hypothetical protein